MFKILSIDGGGIRGVIPAVLLGELEERTGQSIVDLFDLVVGTSTGGILAAGLTVPGDNGRPKYTADDMLDLYVSRGAEIFQRSLWDRIMDAGGALDEMYDHQPLETILAEYLGDATLTDCLRPIVVTTYDIEERQPYYCKTSAAVDDGPDRNHLLRDVARATSAAPTYFEPKILDSLADVQTRRVLVDGGVFVNNPAMCAFAEAYAHGQTPDQIVLAAFGTGIATRKIAYDKAKNWGALGWVQPIISVMMDGESDAADYHLRQLLPGRSVDNPTDQRYFRFDIDLDTALDDLDAATDENIGDLKAEAARIITGQADEIEQLILRLTA